VPKKAKELSALEVKRLTKPGRHAVGGVSGLLLDVSVTGARSWVLGSQSAAKGATADWAGFQRSASRRRGS
jgi:hypothetical protein